MTTRQRAIVSPLLSIIANIKALNLKALPIKVYYIPRQIYSLQELLENKGNREIQDTLNILRTRHNITIVNTISEHSSHSNDKYNNITHSSHSNDKHNNITHSSHSNSIAHSSKQNPYIIIPLIGNKAIKMELTNE